LEIAAHHYETNNKESTKFVLDGMSKLLLVSESVTQLIDLITDFLLLKTTYEISHVMMQRNTLIDEGVIDGDKEEVWGY
jgi:hypothetical protein